MGVAVGPVGVLVFVKVKVMVQVFPPAIQGVLVKVCVKVRVKVLVMTGVRVLVMVGEFVGVAGMVGTLANWREQLTKIPRVMTNIKAPIDNQCLFIFMSFILQDDLELCFRHWA